jgi:protein SCO1
MIRRMPAVLMLAATAGCGWHSGLPTYGTVPEFALTAENGKKFGAADLEGRVWVANFFFTTCNGPCPRMSAQMHKLQGMLKGSTEVRLVSISIDPKRDNTAALAAYAQRWKADPAKWRFLTGPAEQINVLSWDTFHLASAGGSLEHSTKFALVDKKLQIRGFYDSLDSSGLADLATDIGKLEIEIF